VLRGMRTFGLVHPQMLTCAVYDPALSFDSGTWKLIGSTLDGSRQRVVESDWTRTLFSPLDTKPARP